MTQVNKGRAFGPIVQNKMVYRRILVPVDGSAASEQGFKEALRLAKNQKAALRLLNVVDDSLFYRTPETPFNVEALLQDLKSYGREVLKSAQSMATRQGVKAEPVLVETVAGRVADVITGQAKRWKADLIVMGTHGRRGLNRMVLGSDAELVVRNTFVPVLLVHQQPAGRRRPAAKRRK